MADIQDKDFNKVYDKLVKTVEAKIAIILKLRLIGKPIDYKTIKILNLYIRYLESVKGSRFTYFSVGSLIDISNYLNKL